MAITIAEFKETFPEFTATTDGVIQRSLDLADCTVYVGAFADIKRYNLAIRYYAAHALVSSTNQSNSDSSTSKSVAGEAVGSVSVSYAGNVVGLTPNLAFLNSTSYGQMYLQLINGVGQGGFTTSCSDGAMCL